MTTTTTILRFAGLAALLAVGFFLLVSAMWETAWDGVAMWVRANRVAGGLAGLACVVATAIPIVYGGLSGRSDRMISLAGVGGPVSIRTGAIADYVQRVASEFPDVRRMKVDVSPCREGVDLRLRLRVKSGVKVHELCRSIQARVRVVLAEGLGVNEVRHVEVAVHEIVADGAAA
jgi:uncharacterized alkaline shock family protein YloU